MDGSLQAVFQRLLDPGSLGDEGRWLHCNQKLMVVNRVGRNEGCVSGEEGRNEKRNASRKARNNNAFMNGSLQQTGFVNERDASVEVEENC